MFQLSVHGPRQHFQKSFGEGKLILGTNPLDPKRGTDVLSVDDPFLAEQQLELDFQPKRSRVRLTNFGRAVIMPSGQRILRDKDYLLTAPCRISIGQTVIELRLANDKTSIDHSLTPFDFKSVINEKGKKAERAPSISKLSLWFEAIAEFQSFVAGSREFFLEAAKCAFDPGGLDSAMVLEPGNDGCWEIVSSYVPSPELGIGFCPQIVNQVVKRKTTLFHDASKIDSDTYRNDTDFVIAAPVFDSGQQVAAILYATRSMKRANNRIGIRGMEAHFIHLVAQSLSAGLQRIETESRAAHQRALLEQAFSPQVSSQLQRNPEILSARESEVSVLFADLRGFTTIAEQAGTKLTYQLLADLMDRFTEIVMNQNGVILDYFGDGFAAFWNAPVEHPHHPSLAVEAALQLQEEMFSVNQTWENRLGKYLRMGVGVHTGMAQVGNSGSRRRLKYGPRGMTVNLAQRIESATKQIGVPILISESTAARLDQRFECRRVCRTRVPGIREPVTLKQPFQTDHICKDKRDGFRIYEEALEAFENRDLAGAIHLLVQLEAEFHNDSAAEYLLREVTRFRNDENWQSSADPAIEPFQPLLNNQAQRVDRESAPTVPLK